MMTQPIQTFESLTSETSPAGGNASKTGPMARFAQPFARAVAGLKAWYRLGRAEEQLHRMSDRELADLGLCRADIAYAVRQPMVGVAPQFDAAAVERMAAANQNMRRAA
jgi:uncharacterized protein YjiS (DUF1127 family)